MRVVSNTSPVSNLAIIGRLDLLKQRYHRTLARRRFIQHAVAGVGVASGARFGRSIAAARPER